MVKVIPAIDLIDGKCVRLQQGDFMLKKTYRDNPLEVAKEFEDLGAQRLHLVDLDGAKSKRVMNYPVLEKICKETSLIVDFGGGIQQDDDIAQVFDKGAALVTCGSIAIKKPEIFERWIAKYGADRIILAADVKDKKIALHGWQETAETDVFSFIETHQNKGISHVLCTDISRDGMLGGTALELYQEIMQKFPKLKLIASGGIGDTKDIDVLDEANIYGVVVGKAIYEGKISHDELKAFFQND